MEKKEFPNQKEITPEVGSSISKRFSWWQNKLFVLIKFILGILLLPYVYGVSVSFLENFSQIESILSRYFWWGAVCFVLVYFFISDSNSIYQRGHKIINLLFKFFKPLLTVAPSLIPIYTVIIFLLYGVLSLFIKEDWLIKLTLFFIGFTLSLHFVFSAKSLRQRKDFLRASYIFSFSFVYIFNLNLLGLFFSFYLKDFSFLDFLNRYWTVGGKIITVVFRQLFLNK